MNKIMLAVLISFFISFLITPLIIKIIKKLNASQTVLHYVESHKEKSGTPTMAGIIFILSIAITSFLLFGYNNELATVCVVTMLAYGVLGFLDDFIKIKFKQNEGLSPTQKLVGQLAISLILAFYVYNNAFIGTELVVPFFNTTINLGIFIIPFIAFVFLATTNAVNLTDGLDGLAGGVSFSYILSFAFILYLLLGQQLNAGAGQALIDEYSNLLILCGASLGALLCYLMFNSYPASFFMGDTGSLSLGGLIASLAVVTKLSLFVLILGIMFVLSAVSVIIQVAYYKKTKKRVFKMAPLHHHFEALGMNETKIVAIYIIITLIVGVVTILSFM